MPFTIALNKILTINLTLEGKDLKDEQFQTQKEEAEDTRRWKGLSCLWVRRMNIVVMAMLRKVTYKFNVT